MQINNFAISFFYGSMIFIKEVINKMIQKADRQSCPSRPSGNMARPKEQNMRFLRTVGLPCCLCFYSSLAVAHGQAASSIAAAGPA
ncbi:MAG: hypothetical protein RSE46_11635, partial [Janthinobacterium sp.]